MLRQIAGLRVVILLLGLSALAGCNKNNSPMAQPAAQAAIPGSERDFMVMSATASTSLPTNRP